MKLAPILLVLALFGCGGDPGPVAGLEAAGTPKAAVTGNFLLYVSNQSFDRPTVDIAVFVDGREVAAQDFEVKGQHNWIGFGLDLPAGTHELRAVSTRGDAEIRRTITTGTKTWTVVNFWCCGEPDEPKFTVDVSDEPVAFG